ncbi:uncharacterized protein LOC144663243 [Oculina patagonica]
MAQNLLLWFMLNTLLTVTSSRTLCPRIFFQNINEDTVPYKIIEGVYTKQKDDYNNFPVYRRENDNLLFYHTVSKGSNYLVFGLNLNDYFGVAAILYRDPSFWLSSGVMDRNDVFGGIVNKWQYYNRREQTNYYVSTTYSSPMIKAVCVDEDFRECNSDRVYLNESFDDGKGNTLNNRTTDYFYRTEGLFRNLRPVYKHNTQTWYLQYVDSYWIVTGKYKPSNYDDNVYMRVKDFALRPEYISKTWSVHYQGWRDQPNLKVMCRGVTSMSNTCPSNPCDSKATCVYTSGNETLCLCPSGYTGLKCSVNKQCPKPNPKASTELNFAYPGKRPGDLGMAFCFGSYPSMRYYVCVDGSFSSNWSGQGSACTREDPTTAPWYPPTRRTTWYPRTRATPWYPGNQGTPQANSVNFDDNPIIVPVVITVAVLVQILLPFVLWCCALCRTSCKEVEEQEDDQRRMDQVGEELGRRLQRVAVAGSQEELDQGVQEYRQAVQDYQRESEAKELSRKRGFVRNASLCRLISMDLYFSFYLWLIYFVGCGVSHCTMYGSVFEVLRIFAIVMLFVCPVIVFIESCFSHELDYLKNIMEDETAWGYIQRMQEVPPRINMVVECYHYETRTRVVYYTDANGNQQSRTETYTEKVVTFVDQDEFSFGSWVDVSKREMPALSTVALTRVKIDPSILFGDQETADDYERQVAEMLERNRHRDVFTDYSSSKEIPGLKKRISAFVDLSVKPFWIRPLFFWIATLLQMTWPYRWLFRAKTAKSYYALKKKMYKSTTPPMEVDVMNPIAVLAGNASSVPIGPDNTCPGYPMSVINNPGTGNLAFQSGSTPYPPVNPYLGQSDPAHGISTPYPPYNPEGESSLLPYPAPAQPNGPPPLYPAGINNPAPDSSTPYPPLNPYTGPASPPYPAGPQPSAPPPSYEDAVGNPPQPNNVT